MSAWLERGLMLGTPMVAMATVALGLRVGAGSAVRAAVVYAAPTSGAGTGLAWQVVAFDDDHGIREPVMLPEIEVVLTGAGPETRWQGATNEDGTAEVLLASGASAPGPPMHLVVSAGARVLAEGDVAAPPVLVREPPATSWARFSRREGDVVLDVAVLGQRVPTGFPASIWVRATDRATHAPLAGVAVEAEQDSSFIPAASSVTTDARGWAHVVAMPVGHAVGMVLHAKSPTGTTGEWAGGLFVSPGAAQLAVDERVAPGQDVVVDVVVPTMRRTAYVEVDDARGRAWAAAAPVTGAAGENPHATVHVPPLAPGLYWAVEAGDPMGAAQLGAGAASRPFFVAATDEAALAFGTDRASCAPPADPRDPKRAVSICLALAAATPVPRWTALEGFTAHRALDAKKKARGLGIALGAILLAVLLEGLLLLKASAASRARLRAAVDSEGEPEADGAKKRSARLLGRGWTVGIAVLVAMMGFALMAAFIARVG